MLFEEQLEKNGKLIYTNVGVSMLPLLHENKDLMVIEKRGPERMKKYDAVLFIRPHLTGRGRYVLHRILKVREHDYWIVGDNCVSGEYVKDENIIGILTQVIRNGKTLKMDSFRNKLYVTFWCAPYRFRFFVLRAKGFARRCLSFAKRRIFSRKER